MVQAIPLTKGKVALIDDEDFAAVSAFKWCAIAGKRGSWYAIRQERVAPNKQRMIWMHHLILGNTTEVDHKDRDGLNNQRANLRNVTHQQNSCNRRIPNNNKTGYRGVSMRRDRFRAQITAFRRTLHIGLFNTAEEAAHAYDQKAIELFGEFACTNFSA